MSQIFWGIVHFLVTEKKWTIIYSSEEFDEVWVENGNHVIRLYEKTFNWANHLQQDLIRVYSISEQIAKQTRKAPITVNNIYFCEGLPVDDWEYTVTEMNRTHAPHLFHVETRMEKEDSIIDGVMRFKEDLKLTLEEANVLKQLCGRPVDVLKHEVFYYVNNKQEEKKKVLEYGKPRITQILIGIQVMVFLIMTLNGGSTNPYVLIEFGAKYNPLIDQGQWWRLVTSVFIHIGFFHLLMNTVALYYIGIQLERLIGNMRFIILYVVAGIGGSFSSYLFTDGIGAGASGAIFGCFGALFVVSVLYKEFITREVITNILTLIGVNLLFGFVMPNIDNAAHIGGLVVGALLMFLMGVPIRK